VFLTSQAARHYEATDAEAVLLQAGALDDCGEEHFPLSDAALQL
jgi:hypothetical protein